jgi:hypothetical protein
LYALLSPQRTCIAALIVSSIGLYVQNFIYGYRPTPGNGTSGVTGQYFELYTTD